MRLVGDPMGGCHSRKVVTPVLHHMGVLTYMQGESSDREQMAFTLDPLEHLAICLKEAEEKAKALLEQLTVSEGTKRKLLEQVSWLEQKVETVNRNSVSGEPYENMAVMKDKYIEKLQAEVKATQEQLAAYIVFFYFLIPLFISWSS
uniref:Uncharacterized protein n=1 Tax=Nannospalax galili TaxID=1026970 RepID=A0A8C6RQ25_NANGA